MSLKKMVEECKECGKKKDNRLPVRIAKYVKPFIIGQIILLTIAWIISPEIVWNNVLTSINFYSGISMLLLGGAVSFGLIIYDIAGIAGEM